MDTGDCQPLYHTIRDYYEGMNMRIDQQIPMLLVERQALNEAIVGEKHVRIKIIPFPFIFQLQVLIQKWLFFRASIICRKQGVYASPRSRLFQL